MKISRLTAATITGLALVGGLGIGSAVVAMADEGNTPEQVGVPVPDGISHLKMPDGRKVSSITPSWPKNKFGLTVGEATPADASVMNIPDLTPITADNGEEGYIQTDEIIFPMPKSDEEAAAQTRSRLDQNGDDVRTVYGPDGKTALGTVNLGTVILEQADGTRLNPKTGEPLERQ